MPARPGRREHDHGGAGCTDHAERQPPEPMTDAAHRVDFYWRTGCGFCSRLRRGLDAAGVELVEHDIWSDDEARAFVRSVARGYETVPTVVVAGVALVNPSAAEVVAHLDGVTTDDAPQQ